MAIDSSNIWISLLPIAEALAAENSRAGFPTSMPPAASVDVLESSDGSNFIVKIRSAPPSDGVIALRIDAQYWDTDGHVVFLSGYTDREGKLTELELTRLDLQSIDRLPTIADIRFEEQHTGFYKAVKK